MVWWIDSAFTAEGLGSIPGRGTKDPQAMGLQPKKKKKKQFFKELELLLLININKSSAY